MGSELRLLAGWLKENYPRDALMPVRPGTKVPMFPFKGGAWGQAQWADYAQRAGRSGLAGSDVCVVLYDLCVVDVDTPEAAKALESRFPALKTAACERTKRGFHYWFERPKQADDMLVFTGHSAVVPGVDFLTLTSTGTGSIVCVCPSKDKTWIRAPWDTDMRPVPGDLLLAVAAPSVRPVSLKILCADGRAIRVDGRWPASSAYLEPWVSGDLDGSAVVPLTSSEVAEFAGFLEGSATDAPLTRETLLRVKRSCDILGVPRAVVSRRARAERVVAPAWMASVSEEAWRAERRRDLWRAGRLATEDFVVRIELVERDPLPTCLPESHFLWGKHEDAAPAAFSVSPDPGGRVLGAVPGEILRFWEKHRENVVIAGGFVAGVVCDAAPGWGDVDLFVHSCDADVAESIERDFLAIPGALPVYRSKVAVTIACETKGKAEPTTVQLVRRLHGDRAEVVASFDISACQVMARLDERGLVVVEGTPAFAWSARSMAFFVDFRAWGDASVSRVFKYVAKGFDALVPGLKRENGTAFLRPSFDKDTVGMLLLAEHRMRIALGDRPPPRNGGATRMGAVLQIASAYSAKRSGYGDFGYFGRLAHAVRRFFLGSRRLEEAAREPWGACDRTRHCAAMYSPRPSRIGRFREAPAFFSEVMGEPL